MVRLIDLRKHEQRCSHRYSGPSLHDCFDLFADPERTTRVPVRAVVCECLAVRRWGVEALARVIAGRLRIGTTVVVMPQGLTAKVTAIEVGETRVDTALAGTEAKVRTEIRASLCDVQYRESATGVLAEHSTRRR
jgi:translation elongation factor EF-1alpha